MKKLYGIPNCEMCSQIKEWVKDNDIQVDEIIELVEIDKEWHEKTEDGFVKFDKSVHSFPALYMGNQNNNAVYIVGKEGIQSILSKGYIYESKICPYFDKSCIEKECGKFVIMTKGPIQEGGCSDYWTPILLTEMLTKGN